MLTTDAERFYGRPILIRECRDARDLESAIRRIRRAVKPKPNERYVVVVYKRTEETHA